MATKLSWLSTCKLSQLKTIANATGINSSGTKPILASRLLQDLQIDRFSSPNLPKNDRPKTHRIISIDMGIRNLAYCLLAIPSNPPTQPTPPPILEDWARLSISQKTPPSSPPGPTPPSKPKETFDPATYSQHAYNLITTLLTTATPPTHILIERQRFRSMGSSAVQEWTLRVNMFEAMLYAVLQTFQSRGLWTGTVHAVAPGKVATFWLSDRDPEPEPPPRSQAAKTKAAKIDIVARWLQHRPPFVLAGRAAGLGRAFLRRRRGGKMVVVAEDDGLGAEVGAAEMGKLDDLADCLLQGMAWIRWEENRRRVLEGGLEALGTPREKVEAGGGIAEGGKGVGETVASKRGRGRRRAKE